MTVHSQRFREVWIQSVDTIHQRSIPSYSFSYPNARPDAWSLFGPCIVQGVEIICNLIVHYKYCCDHVYIHSKAKAWDGSVCLTSDSIFAQGRLADQHPGLGMHVGKKGQKNRHRLFSHFYYEQHLENVPLFLFVSVCIQVMGWQMVCPDRVCVQRMLLSGLLGSSALCGWERLLNQFGEGASSVLQDFTLHRSASQYSTFCRLCWVEWDVSLLLSVYS